VGATLSTKSSLNAALFCSRGCGAGAIQGRWSHSRALEPFTSRSCPLSSASWRSSRALSPVASASCARSGRATSSEVTLPRERMRQSNEADRQASTWTTLHRGMPAWRGRPAPACCRRAHDTPPAPPPPPAPAHPPAAAPRARAPRRRPERPAARRGGMRRCMRLTRSSWQGTRRVRLVRGKGRDVSG